jgi:phospholipase C
LLLVSIIGACAPTGSAYAVLPHTAAPFADQTMKIRHVVIVVQENRTTDNLFNGLTGANTVRYGKNSNGKTVPLLPEPLTAPYRVGHSHDAFNIDYSNGKMNGFDLAPSSCMPEAPPSQCPPQSRRAYGYVPRDETRPYWQMAKDYAFADEMFQSNQGPSFPAHQYIVSGTSTIADGATLKASENPGSLKGCGAPQGATVRTIDPQGRENHWVFPCFDRTSIFTSLDARGIGWRYYMINPIYNAVRPLKPIWDNQLEYRANVRTPPWKFLKDVRADVLTGVTIVTPTRKSSDHAGATDGTGPSWVAAVVNAVGHSKYWNSTAIFVTWDDWGGWYDHVTPKIFNSYELGFRVPLLVISPYAKPHYVSHKRYEFGSILKFVERNFGLPSLGTTDARANDLSDMFNFTQKPIKFKTIQAPQAEGYFVRQPADDGSLDD